MRRVVVEWKDLIHKNGFTGDHLSWHQAEKERRARIAGQSLSGYDHRGAIADVDDAGVNETMHIAHSRLQQHAGAYWTSWYQQTDPDSDDFVRWLEAIRSLVVTEVAQLWANGTEWHVAWFERTCRAQIRKALERPLKEWASNARQIEIQRLQQRAVTELVNQPSGPGAAVQDSAIGKLSSLAPAGISAGLAAPPANGSSAPLTPAAVVAPPADFQNVPNLASAPAEHGITDSTVITPPPPAPTHQTSDPPTGNSDAANWDGIEIAFLSDERVQVRRGSHSETLNYAEFGFEDGRSGKPDQAWMTLRCLAEGNGIIHDQKQAQRPWRSVEKQVQAIRSIFRQHFNLSGDPLPFVAGTGYQAVFKIRCSPSYST
jgi:hypothetical protein